MTPVTKSTPGSHPCRSCVTRTMITRCQCVMAIEKFWRYVDRVEIVCRDETIAVHPRSYERADFIYNPLHYLALLEQKTKALDQAAPLDDWAAAAHGSSDGNRGTARVHPGTAADGELSSAPGGKGR